MADESEAARPTIEGLLRDASRALEAGQLDHADALFEEVTNRRPSRVEGHLGRAHAALRRGRPAEALRFVNPALDAAPTSVEVYDLAAFVGTHGGVTDLAISWLERGAAALPREPRIFEHLVRLYALDGRLEDLRQCLAHYGRLVGLPSGRAAIRFTRDASLPEDLRSRIAVAAGF